MKFAQIVTISIGIGIAGVLFQALESVDSGVIWERIYFQWTGVIVTYLVLKVDTWVKKEGKEWTGK